MLINEILKESVDNIAVFYGGRFQPMHQGHRDVYKHLVSKFGADNVFIATTFSQKAQKAHAGGNYSEDPFTFDEKASIMNKMFGIPADKIVKTNPYRPDLSAVGKDPNNTATILVYGQKDAARLETGKGFLHDLPKDMNELVPTANLECFPLSPKTSTIKSDAPLIISGCCVNSSMQLTKPPNFIILFILIFQKMKL